MVMVKSSKQEGKDQGDASCPQPIIENQGLSDLKPVLSFSSSRPSQTHLPHPLLPPSEAEGTPDDVNYRVPKPTFDLDSQGGDSGEDQEDSHADAFDEGEYHSPASRISGGQDLLKELDNLEAARPKPKKRQIFTPGNRKEIWEKREHGAPKLNFDSWVDEVAAIEESVSTPTGTRYYKVNDLEDSPT